MSSELLGRALQISGSRTCPDRGGLDGDVPAWFSFLLLYDSHLFTSIHFEHACYDLQQIRLICSLMCV